jgi:hypothetical protein
MFLSCIKSGYIENAEGADLCCADEDGIGVCNTYTYCGGAPGCYDGSDSLVNVNFQACFLGFQYSLAYGNGSLDILNLPYSTTLGSGESPFTCCLKIINKYALPVGTVLAELI